MDIISPIRRAPGLFKSYMDMWEKPMANNSSHLSDEISGDAHIVSFVVPIWKDESPIEGQKEIWRGLLHRCRMAPGIISQTSMKSRSLCRIT